MVCARARFLARPRYLTLAKPHSCLTTRKACSPRARVRERARLIIRQRSLNGRWEVGRRLIRRSVDFRSTYAPTPTYIWFGNASETTLRTRQSVEISYALAS